MPAILSSWKEIAAYVGKGVRTVQRWEHESGFPVRRPRSEKGAVMAYATEIDAWVHSHVSVGHAHSDRLKDELKLLVAAHVSEIHKTAALAQESRRRREELRRVREETERLLKQAIAKTT
jgi:predicted DNA-binding transcriptional regulator AlpA